MIIIFFSVVAAALSRERFRWVRTIFFNLNECVHKFYYSWTWTVDAIQIHAIASFWPFCEWK